MNLSKVSPESKGWTFLTLRGTIDGNLLEDDVSGTVPTDNPHRDPNTGNYGRSVRGYNVGDG